MCYTGNVVIPITTSTTGGVNTMARTVMYQTPHGLVYAAPTTSLPEGVIFNFQHDQGRCCQLVFSRGRINACILNCAGQQM